MNALQLTLLGFFFLLSCWGWASLAYVLRERDRRLCQRNDSTNRTESP